VQVHVDNKHRSTSVGEEKQSEDTSFDPLSFNSFEIQSSDDVEELATTTQENIIFQDSRPGESISYGDPNPSTYALAMDDTAQLKEYLTRPVQIASITWSEASSLPNNHLNPWTLYFNNTYIKNKLANYSRLRCKLHVKFIYNASPFYYGLLRACYSPLDNYGSSSRTSQFFQGASANELVQASQMPGVWIEPSQNTTCEMELPFIWHYDWLDTGESDAFDGMGTITITEYVGLQSANGVVGSSITLRVMAWAEEVEIAAPTKALLLQADEYEVKQGVVSGPASAVASIASKFTNVPIIGTYAKATEMGASMVSGIAKLFGYSNPPIIEDAHVMYPKPFHAFANVETRVPRDVLAIDPKNEVSFDTRIAGASGEDELAINNIVKRRSYLFSSNWSNESPDALLGSMLVTPMLTPTRTLSYGKYRYYTPIGYVGEMFQYWRGSIKITVKAVATPYHRGRIVLAWDPNKDITGDSDTLTTNLVKILDLEASNEMTFEIPYKAYQSWLYTGTVDTSFGNSTTPTYTLDKNYHNGCFTCRVQNVLTGPATAPNVELLFFVEGGDDFEYSVPEVLPNACSANLNIQADEFEVAKKEPHLNTLTVGETIASLRPLLHRTSYYTTQILGDMYDNGGTPAAYGAGYKVCQNLFPRVPDDFGFFDTDSDTVRF
jgi:hypothetical protein